MAESWDWKHRLMPVSKSVYCVSLSNLLKSKPAWGCHHSQFKLSPNHNISAVTHAVCCIINFYLISNSFYFSSIIIQQSHILSELYPCDSTQSCSSTNLVLAWAAMWLITGIERESIKTRMTSCKGHQGFNKTTSQKLRHRFYTQYVRGLFTRLVSSSQQMVGQRSIIKTFRKHTIGRLQIQMNLLWGSKVVLFPLNQHFAMRHH